MIFSREDRMQAASAFRSLFVCSAKMRKARALMSSPSLRVGASSAAAMASAPPTPEIIRDASPANTARRTRAGWAMARNAETRAPIE